MAAPVLRVVRRPKGALTASAGARALTAASAPVTNPADLLKAGVSGSRGKNWQDEAWSAYRCVGELRYYVGWRASSCSRVRLIASEVDPDTGLPTGSIAEDNTEGQRVAEMVRAIAGGPLGQSQLVKRIAECLTVPGEVWVAILQLPEGEKWFALTRKEIERSQRRNSVVIKLPDGTKHQFDAAAGDGMFRVWNHDAEDASLPDSPVRANLDPLREIIRTTRKIRNADNSRLLNNGLLLIPQEASLPASQGPVSADKPGDPPLPAAPGAPVASQLQNLIVQVAQAATEDENSMAALVPIVAAAPGDHISKVAHIELGKDVTDLAIKTRNDAIARLAMGLDVSPERLLGMGSTTNHWSAWQIGDEDVQLHIAPVMETICQAIWDSVLRNVLAAVGVDVSKYVLWYDTSRLTADPDKTDEAKAAFEAGAITAEALVRYYGLADDAMYDFTTIDGWQQWAQDKVSKDPTLLPTLMPLLDKSIQTLEFPQTAALPAGDSGGDPDADGGGESGAERQQEPATEDTADQQAAAASVGAGLSMAVELMVNRALELAGKRRVKTNDRLQRERLRDVAEYDYHRFMPPVAGDQVGRLIKGWDVGLDEIATRYGVDANAVRSVVEAKARRQLTAQVVDG